MSLKKYIPKVGKMNIQEQIDMLIDRLEKAENEIKEIKMIRLNIVREFAERLKKKS